MAKKATRKNTNNMWGIAPNFAGAITFGPAAARGERVRRNIREAKGAKNMVRAQHEMQGWRVTPRSPRKGGADFDEERFNILAGGWERRAVKVKRGDAPLTEKQQAEQKRAKKTGKNYVVQRVRDLFSL